MRITGPSAQAVLITPVGGAPLFANATAQICAQLLAFVGAQPSVRSAESYWKYQVRAGAGGAL
jgi:hypothetical protein